MQAVSIPNSDNLGCLENLLSVYPVNNFLNQYWGQQFLHVPGFKEKFAGLFSWNQLNDALEQFPFEPPRMRLYKAGKEVEPEKFLEVRAFQGRGKTRWLKAGDLTNELKNGATLILNYADELSFPLRELAVNLERIFRTHVNVNLYAAFRSDNGFSLHWDDQDTFILQVAGCKKWLIHEPTKPHPLREENSAPPQPTGTPIWDGILKEGGLFHIPRGWWHVACPVDEPSLHLTISIRGMTGLDVLRWFVDGLKSSANVRMNVPLWQGSDKNSVHVESLRQDLLDAWKPDIIERFLAEVDAATTPRPRLRLPDSVTNGELRIDANTHLKLSSPRPLVISRQSDNAIVIFKTNKKVLQCQDIMLPVLNLLDDGSAHTLRELCFLALRPEHQSSIIDFVNQLAVTGVVTVETPLFRASGGGHA